MEQKCNYTQLNGTGFGEKTWRDAAGMAKTRKSKISIRTISVETILFPSNSTMSLKLQFFTDFRALCVMTRQPSKPTR